MMAPLPEPSFKFRRVFAFGLLLILTPLLAWIIHKMGGDEPLAKLGIAIVVLQGVVVLVYMIAPTAEAIARGIAEARRS
ncbi:MAG: hypothetical protein ACK5MB_07375 [Phycisphaerales bacterium]